ncbi:MAG: hypothetical protein LBS21_04860 [Clostridiales bacterium]|jgi:hypothetical protein|nr:hypothetical protein [Clostridiales bacterium]
MYVVKWTGLGLMFLLVPCVIIIVLSLLNYIFYILTTGEADTLILFPIGLVASSILCWVIGGRINKEKIVASDDEAGTPILVKNIHTLWGIPVQFFSAVYLFLAILCFAAYFG